MNEIIYFFLLKKTLFLPEKINIQNVCICVWLKKNNKPLPNPVDLRTFYSITVS